MRRLVNALLLTLIIGVMAITLALVWKIRETPLAGPSDRRPSERIVTVTASGDRIFVVLRDGDTGVERVVALDGRTFRPTGEIVDPPAR